jgi:hypothetical protein
LRRPAFRRIGRPFIAWAALRAAVRVIFLAFAAPRLAILRAVCLPRPAVTLRLAFRRRELDAFGSMRRAPRTARRAAPVAVRATPAATSVAIDAAPLIVLPALLMMPFFAMGSRSRQILETYRVNKSTGSKLVPETAVFADRSIGLTLRDRSNPALSGGL